MTYVADFETTSYKYYLKNGYTKVWLYGICDLDENMVKVGDSIEGFIEWLRSISLERPIIYFHNLRFDGAFILNYLLNNGFLYKSKLVKKSNKAFTTLIGEMGEYYEIKINFARNKQVIIRDSLKIIPLKVKEIAKSFKMDIGKEIIDYEKYEINEETISYLEKDVKIVARALKFFFNQGYDKMTIGSISYNAFKDSCKSFDDLFPPLKEDWLIEWREAYRGGRTQVNPKYKGQVLEGVRRYDINSMYPYVMGKMPMPYGLPIKLRRYGCFKFELYKVEIWFKLKKGHLPTLLKKGTIYGFEDTYYTETEGVEELNISNIDLELVKRHYNILYLKIKEGWGFKTSPYIFTRFVEEFYELKSSNTGGLKMLYKLIINNLYGKFGSKCRGRVKIPKLEDGELTHTLSEEQSMRRYYLPVAIAITSYSHLLIDNAIMEVGYNNFIYCDTDSVHTFSELPSEWVDNKILGKFKLEGIEEKAKYVRQKTYIYYEKNEYHITCSGMTDKMKEYLVRTSKNVFERFSVGLKIDENSEDIHYDELRLMPKQVSGGVVLKPTQFSLKGEVV